MEGCLELGQEEDMSSSSYKLMRGVHHESNISNTYLNCPQFGHILNIKNTYGWLDYRIISIRIGKETYLTYQNHWDC